MQSPSEITDAELATATGIHTCDPGDPTAAGHQLWGHRSEKSQAETGNDKLVVEVALASDDHVALLEFISRVERLKGRLPPDVQVLRRNLSS
jgi:hypothetical protein